MRLPDFIGIGAPKSGTTWLSRCLAEHPNVFMPQAKELVVFDYDDYEQRLDDYRAHFAAVRQETAVGEFTTRYLASARPAPRMRDLIPDVRLLVCLRNPADQIYSHYWHLLRQNFHQHEVQGEISFEQALERFPDLLKRPARYWDHLQSWLTYFPAERFLVALYDDIQSCPESVLQRTYAFLGVDETFRPASSHDRGTEVRQGVSPRNRLATSIHARLYTTLSRAAYQPLKHAIGVGRANRVKDTLRVRQIMEWAFFRRGYPPLRPGTRAALNREFADQVRGIENFLNRRLDSWK